MVNTIIECYFKGNIEMINNIDDLKNRTFVESNILRSLILSQNDGIDGLNDGLSMDDIVIHEYQMANSITIN